MPKGNISTVYSALQQVKIFCGTEGNKGLVALLAHLVQDTVFPPHPEGTREISYYEMVSILEKISFLRKKNGIFQNQVLFCKVRRFSKMQFFTPTGLSNS